MEAELGREKTHLQQAFVSLERLRDEAAESVSEPPQQSPQLVAFHEGRWMELLRDSTVAAETVRTHGGLHVPSAARQALEGAPVAPGTMSTLRALTDPEKRPPLPRAPLSPEVAEAQLVEAFELDSIKFVTCLRRARRGAAAGPSGMTSDHLFPVLENDIASLLSEEQVPEVILEAIRLGRMTVLSRGIVVGDVASSSRRSKQPQLPSSTPYPPKQDVSALLTSCRP